MQSKYPYHAVSNCGPLSAVPYVQPALGISRAIDARPYLQAPVQTVPHLSSLDGLICHRSQCGIPVTVDKIALPTDGPAERLNKDMAAITTLHRQKAARLISPKCLMRRPGHL